MRWVKTIRACVQDERGQAAVEYVLMLVVLSVFGQWLVQYFIEVLEEGTFILSGNVTYYLHTGTGWE